ncbi:hypothetical protein SEPCBS57363_001854 [Sporothrix epigloea]|uniref:Protein kinase domain-containing protein n=1 Tax=Sporothrix epigloea TaxID=1892477 RepID=A0ABP0DFM7_9PEZI
MQDLATLRAGGYRGAGLTKLKLTEPLDEFPSEIFDASIASTLEILDLSGTGLSALPADLGTRLPRLRIAFFSNCKFVTFPSVALAGCPRLEMVAFRKNGMQGFDEASADDVAFPPQLRWLILTDNCLARIPASISRCHRLEKCMLAGNQLTGLPDAMANCQNLTLLRLAANKLETLPSWLLTMPKLAFLSFAGNPCSSTASSNNASSPITPPTLSSSSTPRSILPHVDWNEIEIHHVLGEGASGIISKGTIRSANTSASASRGPSGTATPALSATDTSVLSTGASTAATSTLDSPSSSSLALSVPTPVAVKIFRGALTSDGTPYDEMAACLAAGQHVNLVQVHGQIRWGEDEDAEEDTKEAFPPSFRGGLIMELIPPRYRVLGQPPSFDSCTRDCFDTSSSDGRLPVPAALSILSGVASAAAHLHERGIAHGDLYAHNILFAHGRAGNSSTDDVDNTEDATHAILSDFGAATLYGPSSSSNDLNSLEKLEVLAFAHLIEDVLGLMTEKPSVRQQLEALHKMCIVPNVAERPNFSTLVNELAPLKF